MPVESRNPARGDHHRVEYNPVGEITRWAQMQNGVSKYYKLDLSDSYDLAGQLHKAELRESGTDSLIKAFQWDYDNAGNRIAESIGGAVASTPANNLNQLTALNQTQATVKGDLNRAATVTVNGSPVPVGAGSEFETQVPLPATDNTVEIQATASDGAVTTNRYNIKKDQPLTYDAAGNLVAEGGRTLDYDAEQRLVRVVDSKTQPAMITEMEYDTFWRRTRIKTTQGSSTLSDRRYVWIGWRIAEERDANAVVTKRFFRRGVQDTALPLFYERDHLGSVRGLLDHGGLVRGSYDFDLWGRRSKLAGDKAADFGFTDHLEDGGTGLTLTWFRGYEPNLGRWISRDPAGERVGTHRYRYVRNMPAGRIDPYGLWSITLELYWGGGGGISFGGADGHGWIELMGGYGGKASARWSPTDKGPASWNPNAGRGTQVGFGLKGECSVTGLLGSAGYGLEGGANVHPADCELDGCPGGYDGSLYGDEGFKYGFGWKEGGSFGFGGGVSGGVSVPITW